jgi:hypothetical protein
MLKKPTCFVKISEQKYKYVKWKKVRHSAGKGTKNGLYEYL